MNIQRYRPGLKTQLVFLIESCVVISVLLIGLILTVHEETILERELGKRGLALTSDLASFVLSSLIVEDLPALRRFTNYSMRQDYVRYVVILDPQAKVIMHSDLREIGKTYKDELSTVALASRQPGHIDTYLLPQKEMIFDVHAPVEISGKRLGTIRLGYSKIPIEKEIAVIRREIFLIGLLAVAAGGVIAFFLASFLSKPLVQLTRATQVLAGGDFDAVISIRRNDEIGALVDSFNQMAKDLRHHRKHMEGLVAARTAELQMSNQKLKKEIAVRKRSEEELEQSRKQLRDLASHLEFIREGERRRMAREIHDELGQSLTALKMDLHWIKSRLGDNQRLLLEKTQAMLGLIDTIVQSVRRISSELRPGLLDDLGLSAAVEWQAEEFRKRTGIECEVTSDPEDIILSDGLSIAVFRILQESLTNVARHAHATRVTVKLSKQAGKIELEVRDNGGGIAEKEISDPRSFGLIGMRERVHSFRGNLTVKGIPSKGTIIEVSLPLETTGECV